MESLQAADLQPYGAFVPDQSFGSIADGSPKIVKEKTPAAPDTDTSTKQTIQKMCEYRRAAANDPIVKAWAEHAHRVYGLNSPDPRAKVWGAYWQVKHGVKFASDEPRLFAVGEPHALDLLIAPTVLVRDKEPKGDCDDFTMLIQALLDQLGIESYTVTVAADPQNPDRWSHVFCVAKLPNGDLCPLDASHGQYPGWMVPREHIFRWQGWDSSGEQANLAIPGFRTTLLHDLRGFVAGEKNAGLHGYVPNRGKVLTMPRRGMRGLGQCLDLLGNDVPCTGDTSLTPLPSSSPSSGLPIDWGSIINNIITSGAKVAQTAELPTGGYIVNTPSGQQVISAGGTALSSSLTSAFSSLGSILPWLLIGVVAFAVIGDLGKGGRR